MGSSSLERVFFWKKKKSPLSKAFSQLKKSLPKKRKSKKKSKKKSILKKLQLDNLKDKKSKKKVSHKKQDKKAPKSLKIVSLGKERKESDPNTSQGGKEKDREGLGRLGDMIKKKFSPENKKELSAEQEVAPLKETNEGKTSLQKLKDIMKPRRQSETKAN